ncbi:hypothetical protein B0H11DRAFT_2259798 [Mycena galericulata]|nr:hypothetical protein B0H11DRAFT_2259798 [Mycena galericulata]
MYVHIPPEIEERFIERSEFLDLIRYSHVARQARQTVHSILALRCTNMLKPYFEREEMDGFWNALRNGEGGLTGSAPVWITQYNPAWLPLDLNAVAVIDGAQHTRLYLRERGWSDEVIRTRIPMVLPSQSLTHSIQAHPASSPLAATTWRFTKNGSPAITLTEVAEQSVFLHLVGAKHTMATMLLTASSLIALHPYECIRRYSTFRFGAGLPQAERRIASIRAHIMGGRDRFFEDRQGSCGPHCPSLLRRLRGGDSVGLLRWNDMTDDLVTMEAYHGFMENRYSVGWTWTKCRNSECETFGFPRDIVSTLPKSAMLSSNPKENKIRRTIYAVEHANPAFPKIYHGVLFATGCDEPFVVPVPLDHGRRRYYTIDDLRAYTWISPRLENFPRYPVFLPPHETVGGATIFNVLGWKEDIGNDKALLIFMTSIHPLGFVNDALASSVPSTRPIHGDVLLLLESRGEVQDLGVGDSDFLKNAFKR